METDREKTRAPAHLASEQVDHLGQVADDDPVPGENMVLVARSVEVDAVPAGLDASHEVLVVVVAHMPAIFEILAHRGAQGLAGNDYTVKELFAGFGEPLVVGYVDVVEVRPEMEAVQDLVHSVVGIGGDH